MSLKKILPLFALSVLGTSLLHADESQPTYQAAPAATAIKIKGIVLLKDYDDTTDKDLYKDVTGVQASTNLDLPGGKAGLQKLEESLQPLLKDKDFTKDSLPDLIAAAEREILLFYKSHNRPVVMLRIPAQHLSSGVLKLIVIESSVGSVSVTGSSWSNSEQLKEALHVQPGEKIDEKKIRDDLDWMNRNPFRTVNLVYVEGQDLGTTNLELQVDEQTPFRVYAGADHTGLPKTGRLRYFAGLQAGNVFGLGHMASYQYTTSSDFDTFRAHTGSYTIPLPWRDFLVFFGGYSQLDVLVQQGQPKTHGKSLQTSFRYEMPTRSATGLYTTVRLGGDFKRTDNVLEYSTSAPATSTPTVQKPVNLTQLLLGAKIQNKGSPITTEIAADFYCSPGKWLIDQTEGAYNLLRLGAKNHYLYIQPSLYMAYNYYADGRFAMNVRGQYSTQNLLPSEQLGIGGMHSVRGYDEREKSADSGLITNLEFYLPSLHLISSNPTDKFYDKLQLLAFFDYGFGRQHRPDTAMPNPPFLMSAGPGVRYGVGQYLSAVVDYGIRLRSEKVTSTNSADKLSKGHQRLHFSVIASY